MKRQTIFLLGILGSLTMGAFPAKAETSSEAIGNAIRKSLPLLGKTGPIFFQKSGCISCHNISLPSMAMVLASERGFAVDNAARKENIKAALASKTFFEPKDLMKLDHVPGETMTTGYTLIALAAEKYPGDALTDAMALWSASSQFGDGSWNLPSHRAPIEYSPFTGTALGLRALQLYGPPAKRKEFELRIAKARRWLEQNTARDNEGRTFRLLGLGWAGADKKVLMKAVDDLIQNQRPDGGWAQLPGLESDAYATGQALYALRIGGGMSPGHETYKRGVSNLLQTQLPDGTWLVHTRSYPVQPYFESGFPHGPDQWISAAATSWATLSLTLALDDRAGTESQGIGKSSRR
jgi:Squalene-hopene cyclase C-terminal domain